MSEPGTVEAGSLLVATPALVDPNACCRPSTVPLMTPLSKPNRNPPIVATTLISTISRVFSPPVIAWFIAVPFLDPMMSLPSAALSAAGTG